MKLADLFVRYRQDLEEKYGSQLLSEQRRAMEAIITCRSSGSATTLMICPDCHTHFWHHHSCSNRACPQCQYHCATLWLNRQMGKLLPVSYYLLTFTLPSQLRYPAYLHQKLCYDALFTASVETIRSVSGNPRYLGAEPGLTAVLHTHSRRLEIHPHIHIIMPGGGICKKKRIWIQGSRNYLFPKEILKELFREKYLACLRKAGISYSHLLHTIQWVARIQSVGSGEPALKYLSRYLYRGVIQERNIVSAKAGEITFEYIESRSKRRMDRTLPAADFLFLILKHVLPRHFRRSRDYGFLHGNARKKLNQIQLLLHHCPLVITEIETWKVPCPACGQSMIAVDYRPPLYHAFNHLVRNRGSPATVVQT